MSSPAAAFDCESQAEAQRATRNKKVKLASLFVLGMIVGMVGLKASQSSGVVDSSAAQKFVAGPPVHGTAGASKAVSSDVITTWAITGRVNALDSGVRTDVQMSGDVQADGPEPATLSPCSRRNALLKGAAAAAALAGTSLPAFAAETTVKMGSDAGQLVFEPSSVKVCKGDTIKWINNKAGPHNVVFQEGSVPSGVDAESFGMASDDLVEEEGGTFSATFKVPGTYEYICSPHGGGGMKGDVEVMA